MTTAIQPLNDFAARLAARSGLPAEQAAALSAALPRHLTAALLSRLPAEQSSAFLRYLRNEDPLALERFLQRNLPALRDIVAGAVSAALREQSAARR
jgi:hypothetical protein